MTTMQQLLAQRSTGRIDLRVGAQGVEVLREAGCSKLRLPQGQREAILINTSGGLAGGDKISISAACGQGAELSLTTQAAERVYRSTGPASNVNVKLDVGEDACLFWLPQETILFEGANLHRSFTVDLQKSANFLAVESVILGRKEMGEEISAMSFRDSWRILRDGALFHADETALTGATPAGPATLGEDGRSFATLLMAGGQLDAFGPGRRARIQAAAAAAPCRVGLSIWNGKLIARLIASDGFTLRKSLISLLAELLSPADLPKTWSF